MLNGKICSLSDLKNKWDSICKANASFIDSKKNIEGWASIVNFGKWIVREQPTVLDVDTSYIVRVEDVEIVGNIDILSGNPKNNMIEMLIVNFSSKMPHPEELDMKLKYSLDWLGFKQSTDRNLSGIKMHMVTKDQDLLSHRNDRDMDRIKTTIKNVAKGIQNEVFYPRENVLCSTCNAKGYCRFWAM